MAVTEIRPEPLKSPLRESILPILPVFSEWAGLRSDSIAWTTAQHGDPTVFAVR